MKENFSKFAVTLLAFAAMLGISSCGDDKDEERELLDRQQNQETQESPTKYLSKIARQWYWMTETKDTVDLHYLEIELSGRYTMGNYRLGSHDNFVTLRYDTELGNFSLNNNTIIFSSDNRYSKEGSTETFSTREVKTTEVSFSVNDLEQSNKLTCAFPKESREGESFLPYSGRSVFLYMSDLREKHQDKDRIVREIYQGRWMPVSMMVDYYRNGKTTSYVSAWTKDVLEFKEDGTLTFTVSSEGNPFLTEDVVLSSTYSISNGNIYFDYRYGDLYSFVINSQDGNRLDIETKWRTKSGIDAYQVSAIAGDFVKVK